MAVQLSNNGRRLCTVLYIVLKHKNRCYTVYGLHLSQDIEIDNYKLDLLKTLKNKWFWEQKRINDQILAWLTFPLMFNANKQI